MARDFECQVVDVHVRVVVMNDYTALGIPLEGRGVNPSWESPLHRPICASTEPIRRAEDIAERIFGKLGDLRFRDSLATTCRF